eukprot:5740443-Prymnesium_polylepis.1
MIHWDLGMSKVLVGRPDLDSSSGQCAPVRAPDASQGLLLVGGTRARTAAGPTCSTPPNDCGGGVGRAGCPVRTRAAASKQASKRACCQAQADITTHAVSVARPRRVPRPRA